MVSEPQDPSIERIRARWDQVEAALAEGDVEAAWHHERQTYIGALADIAEGKTEDPATVAATALAIGEVAFGRRR